MATAYKLPSRIHDGKYFPPLDRDYSYIVKVRREPRPPESVYSDARRRPPHSHSHCDCHQHHGCSRCRSDRRNFHSHNHRDRCDSCDSEYEDDDYCEQCESRRHRRRDGHRHSKARSRSEVPPLQIDDNQNDREARSQGTQANLGDEPNPAIASEAPRSAYQRRDAPPVVYKVLKPTRKAPRADRERERARARARAMTPNLLEPEGYETLGDASCPCCAEVNQINAKRQNHGPKTVYPWYAGVDKKSRKALLPTEMPMRLYGNPYKPYDGTLDLDQLYSYLKPTYFDMVDDRDGPHLANQPTKWQEDALAANDLFNTGLNKLKKTATKW